MLTQEQIIEIFKDKGVMLDGHFLLTSGRHSDRYMQCAKLFQYPEESQKVCKVLADKLKGLNINLIAGPALGGVIMAYEMGRQLGVPNVFAERQNGMMEFRRGFAIPVGARVLVTEDVVTTGGSVKEVMELIEKSRGKVAAVASVVDRSGGNVDFDVPFYSAIKIDAVSYEPENCPLCKKGSPAVKPGSRNLSY